MLNTLPNADRMNEEKKRIKLHHRRTHTLHRICFKCFALKIWRRIVLVIARALSVCAVLCVFVQYELNTQKQWHRQHRQQRGERVIQENEETKKSRKKKITSTDLHQPREEGNKVYLHRYVLGYAKTLTFPPSNGKNRTKYLRSDLLAYFEEWIFSVSVQVRTSHIPTASGKENEKEDENNSDDDAHNAINAQHASPEVTANRVCVCVVVVKRWRVPYQRQNGNSNNNEIYSNFVK